MPNWISRYEALLTLAVKPQTLYAYVSRGLVDRRTDPKDSRCSLYRWSDIKALADKRLRGKDPAAIAASTISWGEPIIATRISTVQKGRLLYRGRDAVAMAEECSLEEVAQCLWALKKLPCFSSDSSRSLTQTSPTARAFEMLSIEASLGLPIHGRSVDALSDDGSRLITAFAYAFNVNPNSSDPLHSRVALAWNLSESASDLIRRALVLRADQELNTSTFAARVAASTGASLAACMLAGLAALSGPLQGTSNEQIDLFVNSTATLGVGNAIKHYVAFGKSVPGFGHELYPDGDERAIALLKKFDPPAHCLEVIEKVYLATGQRPNLDFAVFAMVRYLGLTKDAAFWLFALSRSVGWVAHSIEQTLQGGMIRPRARYEVGD